MLLCYRALSVLLAFAVAFIGVPLPVPERAPQAVKVFSELLGQKESAASQVKAVQTETVTIGDKDTTVQTTLTTPVTLANTFLIGTIESESLDSSDVSASVRIKGGEGLGLFQVNFEDPSTVNVERARASDKVQFYDATAQVTPVEFNDGIKIHSGISTFAPNSLIKNIALPTLQADSYFNVPK